MITSQKGHFRSACGLNNFCRVIWGEPEGSGNLSNRAYLALRYKQGAVWGHLGSCLEPRIIWGQPDIQRPWQTWHLTYIWMSQRSFKVTTPLLWRRGKYLMSVWYPVKQSGFIWGQPESLLGFLWDQCSLCSVPRSHSGKPQIQLTVWFLIYHQPAPHLVPEGQSQSLTPVWGHLSSIKDAPLTAGSYKVNSHSPGTGQFK